MNIWAEPYPTKTAICVPKAGYDVAHDRAFILDRPHGYHEDYIIVNFTSDIEVLDRNGKHREKSGACIIYAPGDAQWYAANGATFSHHWLHMNGSGVQPLIEQSSLPIHTIFYSSADAIAPIFRRIVTELSSRREHWDHIVESLVAQLVWEMARGRHPAGDDRDAIGTIDKFADIRLALYENPHWNWKLKAMARKACLSVSRFIVLYGKRFGESPMSDLMTARIQRSRWLLAHTRDSIKEIAQSVGIGDQAYFCRAFSKKTGMTPSQYRDQQRTEPRP
jgi:AraC-like DNA-binding protein